MLLAVFFFFLLMVGKINKLQISKDFPPSNPPELLRTLCPYATTILDYIVCLSYPA